MAKKSRTVISFTSSGNSNNVANARAAHDDGYELSRDTALRLGTANNARHINPDQMLCVARHEVVGQTANRPGEVDVPFFSA